jgi:hypothetical protein
MPSSPPPDRFQREIDDIVRLAERRLEHQSFGYRMRRSSRRLRGAMDGLPLRLPSAETLGGLGLVFLMLSWLLSIFSIRFMEPLRPWILAAGIIFLVLAIITSLLRGRAGGSVGGGNRMWRGERISYGSPYGESFLSRLKRIFRGR